jgi:peptidoglycan/LPS O-acetylase OafA/YrhL
MPRPVEGTSSYNPGLDGIRAVAVLGVIAYHQGWSGGGLLGVGVFFVLSGYLITDLLVSEVRRTGGLALGSFWRRRARRLLPALFTMLFVTVAWATLFDRSQLPGLRSDVLPAIFYFSNWWYIFHHVSYFARFGPPAVLGHLWSLAIEEQFYLLWPLVLLAGLRWVRDRRVIVAAILALASGSAIEMALLYHQYADPTRVYDGTDTRAFALLIGAALAFCWSRERSFTSISPGARRIIECVGGAALAGILALYWTTGQYDPFVYPGGMVLLSVLTAVLIAACVHPGSRIGRVLGVWPLRWTGERSYGLYLWQVPVIVLTTPQGASPNALRDLLQLAAIFALAALSWQYVEQPVRHGALGRITRRARELVARRQWGNLRAGPRGWAVTGGVAACGVVCVLGLSGAIPAASLPKTAVTRIVPPPHHRADPPTTVPPSVTGSTPPPPPAGQGVTAIGDSIMIDADPYLQQLLPGIVVDAQIGQQLTQVAADVGQLKAQGDVGTRLILELGTNGYYSPTQLVALLHALGPMRRIVLVNTRETRPWEQGVNQTIAQVARSYPNTTMVDWYTVSANQPQYFEPDGVHLTPTGARAYASLLARAVQPPTPVPARTTAPRGAAASSGHDPSPSPPRSS